MRQRRSLGQRIKLGEAQAELARARGFASWTQLKGYVARLGAEQPFQTDIGYYEGRADGIATVNGVSRAEARLDLARRHGFPSWNRLRLHVSALACGSEPPTPFMLAYRAVEDDDPERLVDLLDAQPALIAARGTNGNDLLGIGQEPPGRPAPARPWRRSEPRQRLRLDEAPPGGLREPGRARAAPSRRRRATRHLSPGRRRHAADRGPLLGTSRGGTAARARTREPARRGGPRPRGADR